MSLESQSNKLVDEYIFRTGESVKSIDEIYKRLRRHELQQKKLAKVEKELRGEIDITMQHEKKMIAIKDNLNRKLAEQAQRHKEATQARRESIKTQTIATVKGHLYAAAIRTAKNALVEIVKETGAYSQALNIYTGNIEKASAATDGLVSNLDIMMARNKLNVLGVKMTDEQYEQMLGSLTKLSAAMNIDFKFALESTSRMLAMKSRAVADNVGVVVEAKKWYQEAADALNIKTSALTDAQKATIWHTNALSQLNKKAAELPDRVVTATDAMTKMWTSAKNTALEYASALDRRVGMALENMSENLYRNTSSLKLWREEMQRSDEAIRATIDDAAILSDLLLGLEPGKTAEGGAVGAGPGGLMVSGVLGTSEEGRGTWRGKWRTKKAAKAKKKPRWAGKPVGGETSGADWQIKQNLAALKSTQEQAVAERELSDAIQERARSLELVNRAMKEGDDEVFLQRQWALNDIVRQNSELIMDLAVTSLASLADGFWDAADAALSGAQSWQQAMGGIAKAVALSAAKIATIEALKNVAYALHATGLTFLPGGQMAAGGAAAFWGSAAKWGLIAGVTGALGLGMSAAGAGGGGGAASGAGGGRAGTLNLGRTSIGKKVTADDYTIVINNYWGNEKNPSKNYIQQQVITKVAMKNAA